MSDLVRVENIGKTFTLHNQGGVRLPVLANISFIVQESDCLVLHGPSGAGKSSLLRMLYGNYKCTQGRIEFRHRDRWIDVAKADPRDILDLRRHSLSYVSQFLRVIPRVSAIDIVMEPLLVRGMEANLTRSKASEMLERLNIPQRLWGLAPATFSGGEQQRINIARSFIAPTPVMLLDEPTASLDAQNRNVVIELISEVRKAGSALIGIFHDEMVRERVSTRRIEIQSFNAAEAA